MRRKDNTAIKFNKISIGLGSQNLFYQPLEEKY